MKIIILPGLDGTGRLLSDFAKALSPGHDVEVVTYPDSLFSYDDLEVWLKARLPSEPFVMIAESFSGPLALSISANRPRNLAAVVFVATFARSPRRLPSILLSPFGAFPIPAAFLAHASLPFVVGRFHMPGFKELYRSVLQDVPLRTLILRLKSVLSMDRRNIIPQIKVPCCYLQATADRLVPASAFRDFEDNCGSPIRIEAPHFMLQMKPEEAARTVRDFIAGLGVTAQQTL